MDSTYVAIVIISLVVLAFENYIHYRERKDLYSRLMAKDLTDYSIVAGKKHPGKAQSFIRKRIQELEKQDVIE